MIPTNTRSKEFRDERQLFFSIGYRRCNRCLNVMRLQPNFTPNTAGANGFHGTCNECRRVSAFSDHDGLSAPLYEGAQRAKNAGLPCDSITPAQLLEHWQSQGIDPWACAYTGVRLTRATRNIDHVQPLSAPKSVGHVLNNLVPAHKAVNRRKGSKHFIYAVGTEV